MWFIFALLSAVFAALTSILAKVGIEGVNSNRCRSCDGMGNGISDQWTERYRTDWQEKLDFSDSVGSGNRSFLALLLPCAAAWTGIEGSADR